MRPKTIKASDFDHKCTDRDCPYFGAPTWAGSCKCHVPREAMMLKAISDLWDALDTTGDALERLCKALETAGEG